MGREEAIRRIEVGERLGVRTSTDDAQYLGWVLVRKRSTPPVSPQEDDPSYLRWVEETRARPYHVHRVEVKLAVHNSDEYEDNADKRNILNYYVETVDEVESILRHLGHTLEELQDLWSIDAP